MYKGSISIDLGDNPKEIISLMNKDIYYKRSKNKIRLENSSVHIDIEADDPVALVSSMSGVLKQIRIISEVNALVKEERKNVGKGVKRKDKKRI